jgi:hypothetical protein
VSSTLTADYADSYAGLRVDRGRDVLVIYRIPAGGVDEAARYAADGTAVDFEPARYSLAQLLVTRGHVTSDEPYWKARGITISSVSPAADGSGVVVGTPQVDQAEQVLPARYAPVAVKIVP